MYQTIEAIIKSGVIQPLETVQFEEGEQLIIIRISKNLSLSEFQALEEASHETR